MYIMCVRYYHHNLNPFFSFHLCVLCVCLSMSVCPFSMVVDSPSSILPDGEIFCQEEQFDLKAVTLQHGTWDF